MRSIGLLLLAFVLIDVEADRNLYRKYWRRPTRAKCSTVKCNEGCVEEKGPDGCPICICRPICPELQCKPYCELKTTPGSPCPTCECPDVIDDAKAEFSDKEEPRLDERLAKPACSPPKCPEECEIEKDFDGPCPGCKCFEEKDFNAIEEEKPFCSPPKCPPECEVEKDFDGPCPGCKCPDKKSAKDASGRTGDILPDKTLTQCDEYVKCGRDCREVTDEKGCVVCDCKPLCSPPKCGEGCYLEKDPKSPCPECVCEEEEKGEDTINEAKSDCFPLSDDCKRPSCAIRVDEKGCDVCKCEPICTRPKCPRRCKVEKSEGECPKCVCPKFRYG